MDKLKVVMAWLKKQHFWVMSVTVLLVGLIGWFVATSKAWATYKADRGKIEREFDELRQITSQERENQVWIDGIQEEIRKLKIKVREAWDQVYAEQRNTVLKWPKVLGETFLRIVPDLAQNEEIPVDLRENYWSYIKDEFPRLLAIVDARSYLEKVQDPSMAAPVRQGPGPGGRRPKQVQPETERAHDYKVIWDPGNQAELAERLDWKSTPTTHEVRNAQEDLWVYQALLTIIARLNDRAKGHHDAKIKEIESLLIGQAAASEFQAGMEEGRIEVPDAASSPNPAMPSGEAQPPRTGATGAQAMPGQPGEAGDALDEGRYVDEKGMPLGAGSTAPPEFKRMPVVIRLLMDEHEISRLLVECANSPLPVEVRQFRIRPAGGPKNQNAPRAAPQRFSAGGQRFGGAGAAGGPFGGMRMGGSRPGAARAQSDSDLDKSPYDVSVELQGIIYIFNPPDQTKLADAVAPGEQPADGQPADAGAQPADAAPGEAAAPAEGGEAPAKAAEQPADDGQAEEAPARQPAGDEAAAEDEGAGGENAAEAPDAGQPADEAGGEAPKEDMPEE